jgi:hypothetical protein
MKELMQHDLISVSGGNLEAAVNSTCNNEFMLGMVVGALIGIAIQLPDIKPPFIQPYPLPFPGFPFPGDNLIKPL